MSEVCDGCMGRGWDLFDTDTHGLRVERCDMCQLFCSDKEAEEVATRVLKAALEAYEALHGTNRVVEHGQVVYDPMIPPLRPSRSRPDFWSKAPSDGR